MEVVVYPFRTHWDGKVFGWWVMRGQSWLLGPALNAMGNIIQAGLCVSETSLFLAQTLRVVGGTQAGERPEHRALEHPGQRHWRAGMWASQNQVGSPAQD